MGPSQRRIYLFLELMNQKVLNTQSLADEFAVDPHTIRRDISSIRQLLAEWHYPQNIEYNRQLKGYRMYSEQHELNHEEVLVLIKVLLASRALNKKELSTTINGLLNLIPEADKNQVKPLIQNEWLHYTPPYHGQALLNTLWQLSLAISEHTTLTIDYQRRHTEVVTRTILPKTLIFSEFYFYLIAYSPQHKRDLFYRVDRISSFKRTRFLMNQTSIARVEAGKLRQKTQYMYQGKAMHIVFQFWGVVEAALDRFPTATITRYLNADGSSYYLTPAPGHYHQPERDGSVIIEADIDGEYGAMMWLLSQGKQVKVLAPESFRIQVQKEIQTMLKRYV